MTWYLGGKWRLESLIDRYIFPSHILTIGGQVLQHWPWYVSSPIILSPLPLALCTSVTLSFLQCFGKALLSLTTGLGLPLTEMVSTPCPSFLTAQLRNHVPVRAAYPSSCPSQALCYVSSMTVRLSFWALLSAAHAALGLQFDQVWFFPWGWKCPESRNRVRFCASLSLQCLHLIKFVAPKKRATKVS